MPYIEKSRRQVLDINAAEIIPQTSGELNYMFAKHIDRYLTEKGLSYSAINEVVGVLECLKLEIYRRIAVPYEDKKKEENGDVFREDLL